ncbi:MAG: major capsid protein [Aeromonas sp.]
MSVQKALESGKFTVQNLTAAINRTKTPKTRLAELGLFESKGITTTHADIEFKDGKLIIVSDKQRGEDGDKVDRADRDIKTVRAVHLPVVAELLADDLQDVRAFGEEYANDEGGERFDEVITELFEIQRQSLELTIEMMRFGALTGIVYGKAGNVILDMFALFGLDRADAIDVIDFTAAKGVRNQLAASLRTSKKHQAGVKATKYRALCSASFMDALLEDEGFRKAYDRYQDSAAFREDVRGGILWDGIVWEEHTEELPSGALFVPEGSALLVPENNKGLLLTRFAPANYNETVNTVGLPFYSQSEPMKFNKGLEIEAQSNPINVCTSPLAVRQLQIKSAAPAARTTKAAAASAAQAE